MQFGDWFKEATNRLKANDIDTYYLDSLILGESVLGESREHLLAHPDLNLTKKQTKQLEHLTHRREKHEPVSYLVNKSFFYGREFFVNKDVLIPKPETEDFINLLKDIVSPPNNSVLLDVGTGSGCLAITAKLEFPSLKIYASDLCKKALKAAKTNSDQYCTDIKFVQADLIPTRPEKLNIIFANLPYVPLDFLVSSESLFEPKKAIFANQNGLEQIFKLIPVAFDRLFDGGHLLIESLQSQQSQIIELAIKTGFFHSNTKGLITLFTKTKD